MKYLIAILVLLLGGRGRRQIGEAPQSGPDFPRMT